MLPVTVRVGGVDSQSFEAFYADEYRAVVAFARVLTGDLGRAEDVAQEAFAAALQSWASLDNPSGWVRRVAANMARSGWRRRYAEDRAMSRLDIQVRLGSDLAPEADGFWELVRRLPTRQRQVVALFYLEDRPVAEIAQLLGCGESTARVHLSRARRRLAEWLEVEHE